MSGNNSPCGWDTQEIANEDWLFALDAIDDLVMLLDLDHKILAANKATFDATGLSREEIIDHYCYEIFHNEAQPPALCPHQTLKNSIKPESSMVEMEMLGGCFMVTASPVFDKNGDLSKVLYIAKDTSKQQKATSELVRINRALNVLNKCSEILAQADDESKFLIEACKTLTNIGGYKLAWIGSALEDKEKSVKPVAQSGFRDDYLKNIKITWADEENGRGPTGSAIRNGTPIICQNILTDRRFAPWKDEALKRGYASSAALPLIVNEKTIGALNIYAAEQHAFGFEELRMLMGFAAQLSFGIRALRTNKERKNAQTELAKKSSEWAYAMNFMEDAIYLIDLDDKITHANQIFYNIIGLTPEQTIGKDIASIIHPKGESVPCPVCIARREKKDALINMEADHPDNPTNHPIQIMVKIIRDEKNTPLSVLMGIRDLSPIEELRRQAQVIDQVGEAVITVTEDGLITTWNNGAKRLFDYSSQEAIGKNISQLLLNDETSIDLINLSDQTDRLFMPSKELVLTKKSGDSFYSFISMSYLRGQKGKKKGIIFSITDISDRKAAELKLIESEERFRSLAENSSDWIWEFDENNIFTYASPKIKDLLGYTPEEVVGKKSAFDLIPPQERDKVDTEFSSIKENKLPFSALENANQHKDGRLVFLESSGVPILDNEGNLLGYRGIDRDITDRKNSEIAQLNQARLWALGSDIGKALTTEENLQEMLHKCCEAFVRRLNVAFSRIWAFDAVENVLRLQASAGMYTHLDGPHGNIPLNNETKIGHIATERKAVLTNQVVGDKQITDQEWAKKEGMVAFAGHPLVVRDRLVGVLAIFSKEELPDIILKNLESVTVEIAIGLDRKLAEEEKETLQKQIRQMQKMEAIGTLAGGIAHDFNNILMAILGYSDLLKLQLKDDDTAQDYLAHVIQAGQRAKELVAQILTFSRQTEHERKPLLMHLIVKETLKLLRSSIPTTIEVKQKVDAESGSILADPTEIHQIIMNLCTNAYHAMKENGGTLEINLHPISITTLLSKENPQLAAGNYIKLTIKDTGKGIPPGTLERIFDPYFTTKEIGEGTGLGLAVVHGIVQSLNGLITVDSKINEGSTFEIYLPKIDSPTDEDSAVIKFDFPTGTERILFVDDDKTIMTLTLRTLERLGYNVVATSSSIEALDLFKADPNSFDLIITDQVMPQMTGSELSKAIIDIRPDTPIIMLTGFSYSLTPDAAKRIGIREYVMKPIVIREIAKIIRKVLDNPQ